MITAVLKSFGREYLDVAIRSGDLRVHIMERPALWMQDAEIAALQDKLRHIAARTLPEGDLTYGVFAPNGAGLRETVITLVTDKVGAPVAFNALAIMTVDVAPQPQQVLHLGLVMVDPDVQQRNLSWVLYGVTCFLIFARRQLRPIWISNVTQVPAVVGMVDGMFSDVWPGPRAGPRKLSHLMLARGIMAEHRAVFGVGSEAVFDEDSFVISNAYTGGSDALGKSWEGAPKHRDAAYNAYCDAVLDYDRGDDVLQIGRMEMAAMRRYLVRAVPRSAVLSLLVTAVVVALRHVVLPVLHWADADQDWRDLRRWTGAGQLRGVGK